MVISILKKRGSKKAQLTAYVIVGIIILFLAGFVYVLTNANQERTEPFGTGTIPVEARAVRSYVETCIYEETKPLLYDIARRGGTLRPLASEQLLYEEDWYTFACIFQLYKGCVNKLFTRKSMQDELETALEQENAIKDCVNLQPFRDQGYTVTTGALTAEVKIAADDVHVDVHYPLKFTKDDFLLEVNDFSSNLLIPLGKLVDLTSQVVFSEVEDNFFDEDAWMAQTGEEIQIEKHKPYPDSVYKLTTKVNDNDPDLVYLFAIQGESSVDRIGEKTLEMEHPGYCIFDDKTCYANVDQRMCTARNGLSLPGTSENRPSQAACSGLTVFSDASCDGPCKDCDDQGKPRKHGESWCAYDNAVTPGFDYVGSRHYQRSCINGKIYFKECRDYREEVCSEYVDPSGLTRGVCRPNRWQNCSKQSAEQSCLDAGDCYWSGFLKKSDGREKKCDYSTDWEFEENEFLYADDLDRPYATRKCHPRNPPGFKFWLLQGTEVCGMANEIVDGDLESDHQSWVDSSSAYCYFMGDCGAWRNVADQLDEKGYINTDTYGDEYVRDYVYFFQGAYREFNLAPDVNRIKQDPPIERKPLTTTGNEFTNPKTNTNNMMSQWAEYANCASEEFTEGKIKSVAIQEACCNLFCTCPWYWHYWIRQMAFCMPWQAPDPLDKETLRTTFSSPQREQPEPKCNFCNEDARNHKPCTEYKCRSLGSNCIFETDNQGYGVCRFPVEDNIPPIINFDKVETPRIQHQTNYHVAQSPYEGVFLCNGDCTDDLAGSDGLQPYDKIKFTISSPNDLIKCKVSMFPIHDYSNIDPFLSTLFINRVPTTQSIDVNLALPSQFKSNHTVEFTIFPYADIYEKFSSMLNTEIPLQLVKFSEVESWLHNVTFKGQETLNRGGLAEQAREFSDLWKSFRKAEQSLRRIYEEFQKDIALVLVENHANKQLLFFNCIDQAGNQNDDFFVEYRIGVDKTPPEIMPEKTNPLPLSVLETPDLFEFSVSLNEPAECKYSFSSSDAYDTIPAAQKMNCQTSMLDTFDGYYRCSAVLSRAPIIDQKIQVSVYCKDNPVKASAYHIMFQAHDAFEVRQTIENDSIELIPPNIVKILDASAVSFETPIIGVPQDLSAVNLDLVLPKEAECRYTLKEIDSFEDIAANPLACSPENTESHCRLTALSLATKPQTITILCAEPSSQRAPRNPGPPDTITYRII